MNAKFQALERKTVSLFSGKCGKKQKESPEVFFKKMCFQKFRKIYKKTPVPESLFRRIFFNFNIMNKNDNLKF